MGGSGQLPSLLPPDFFHTFKIPYDLEPIGNGVVSRFDAAREQPFRSS